MLAGADGLGWAQIGYQRLAKSSNTYFFTQWTANWHNGVLGRQYPEYGGLPSGQVHQFWVQFDSIVGLKLNVDTTTLESTTWDPRYALTSPANPQYSGEVSYVNSFIPGTSSVPVNIWQVQAEALNGLWTNGLPPMLDMLPHEPGSGHTTMTYDPNLLNHFSIWD